MTGSRPTWAFWAGVLALVGVGLLVRVALIASPAGALDADEAVVGLMARRIAFGGERPIFYYGQAYLGTLEPFTAAVLFSLFPSSTALLKLVPALYSLLFLGLSAALTRSLFGAGPALVTAAYLALPPAMWALWSTKARGGYAEMLFLGQALLLVTVGLAERRGQLPAVMLWGLIAGLALWTHPLAVVFVVASGGYLLAMRGRGWSIQEVVLAAGGLVLGAAPLLIFNFTQDFATVGQLLEGSELQPNRWLGARCLGQLSLPVLAGVVPQTAPVDLAAQGCGPPTGPPARVALLVLVVLVAVLGAHTNAVRLLLLRRRSRACAPALLVGLVVIVLGTLIVAPQVDSAYGEPRYALPLFAAVPLLAGAAWRLPLPVRAMAVGLVLALNGWSVLSLVTLPPQPGQSLDTTAQNRAELIDWLGAHDRHQMHTDYWIAFPVMFESHETIQAEVVSSGPNRYIPYADSVRRTPNAVWVFVRDSDPEQRFRSRLQGAAAVTQTEDVSVYRIYLDVAPETVGPLPL